VVAIAGVATAMALASSVRECGVKRMINLNKIQG
jgi:hypothetical protein